MKITSMELKLRKSPVLFIRTEDGEHKITEALLAPLMEKEAGKSIKKKDLDQAVSEYTDSLIKQIDENETLTAEEKKGKLNNLETKEIKGKIKDICKAQLSSKVQKEMANHEFLHIQADFVRLCEDIIKKVGA